MTETIEKIESLPDIPEEDYLWVSIPDLKALAETIKAQDDEIREMREALTDLKSEVHGCLNVADYALRDALGNTNVNCLQAKVVRAQAVLDKYKHQ